MRKKHDMPSKIGQLFASKSYGNFKIIFYESAKRVHIQFLSTGYISIVSTQSIEKGSVRDPYYPSLYGIGYIGEGNYSSVYYRCGRSLYTKAYTSWISRMGACYNPKSNRHHNYKNAEMCKKWHNFQNYAEWYYRQVKLYGSDGCVDKDLLLLGNTVYSEVTCSYIPNAINCLFVGNKGSTIKGASYCKSKGKWVAQLQEGSFNTKGKRTVTRLGTFNTESEAIAVYIHAKADKIRRECLKYQEKIPPNLFYKLYTGAENYINYYMFEKENYNE